MRTKWVEIIDKGGNRCKIWLRSVLDISDSLGGRGMTVWEGVLESESDDVDGPQVVVKDSWIDPLRKSTEGMILHRLKKYQIEGVPMLISEEHVKKSLRDSEHLDMTVNHSTHFLRSALPQDSVFDLRILSHLVSRPVGKLTVEFSSLGELLIAYLDHIITHKDALEVAGVLHRDISPSNLFFAPARNWTNHRKLMDHLSGKAQQRLFSRSSSTVTTSKTLDGESSLSDCPLTSPVEAESVNGYDNLIPTRKIGSHDVLLLMSVSNLTADDDIMLLMGSDNLDDDPHQTIDLCPLYRTGTWSWMSVQLVMAGPGQPVVHNALHDLESFFYILVGICVLYDGPSKQKSEADLAECFDRFFNTFEPSILKTLAIQSDLTWTPLIVKHIHPYFKPIIPLLSHLRAEIILPLAMNENERERGLLLQDYM
ncbi:hypothetical protein JVT61DRAFT_6197 [Boletus reticuloceps]|uniref:Fungal-type protein kinase domain-containing protein n=1 Tax=Boletus reticuloceps TaxID=495285 RepID=A0A8I2YJK2_9AGAM|nr:hypothetical protein JVT61DRAFT_6197 [Boletus reticuloceps]